MCWTGRPNARNIFIIFNATCRCLCAPVPGAQQIGPIAHALVQQCRVNVAKRVQSKCCAEHLTFFKFDPTSSNILQHITTGLPNVGNCNMLCPTMLHDVALKCCARLARPLESLRWPNTVFALALANAMQGARKDWKKKHGFNTAIINYVWRFFPSWSLIISEKCMVTPNFLFGYQKHLLSSGFSA